ncbi:indigoidine synthase A-like protein [Gymnopilus junonius]|uniref:Indigoidine synthase A-like protein n=1 Tax=Gymnopilus junonius TaxID=109634 RepID=A0A9P5NQJ1_GYMJU|nr:indigoidine synthase A-like protein [Gymnopilus junonius]
MHRLRSLRLPKSFVRGLSSGTRFRPYRLKGAPVDVHPEIEDALAHDKPVVALETALVTHGLPFPSSLEVPMALEEIVRSTGSIPATIGMIDGRVKIGLERHELERLADRRGKPSKISRRDIAAAIALEADGGTTCSATLVFTALAGIKVFATGGLGGVHRGGENSMDVSADLQELTRCPVGLVSSGVKSILDIRRTLEYLETLGVPVISYGESREFPAFFSRHSGHNVPWNVDNPYTAAKILYTQWQLGLQNGALIAVPIPEEYEEVGKEVQEYVDQAIQESEQNGVSKSGKDATPWLLDRIAELSGGQSLASNVAVLKNTALVGGQIAVSYQKLAQDKEARAKAAAKSHSFHLDSSPSSTSLSDNVVSRSHQSPANVVVIGSAAVDITAQELPNTQTGLAVHSTAPGHIKLSVGGVGRNIAEASYRIMEAKFPALSSLLISPVGPDTFGQVLVKKLTEIGMRTDGLIRLPDQNAVCNMVLDSKGALVGGVADMAITERVTGELVLSHLRKHSPSIVAVDANLPTTTLDTLVQYCQEHKTKVLYEPTSTIKSTNILPAIVTAFQEKDAGQAPVTYCTPNLLELTRIYSTAQSDLFELMDHPRWWSAINSFNLGSSFRMELENLARKGVSDFAGSSGTLGFLIEEGIATMAINLLPFFQHLIIKCGEQGVLVVMCIAAHEAPHSGWANARSNIRQRYVVAHGNSGETLVLQHFPSLPVESVANVTGAGDTFVGALLATLANDSTVLYHPSRLGDAINTAQKAAVLTLQSHSAVSPELSRLDK